jgi:hypothetical protein
MIPICASSAPGGRCRRSTMMDRVKKRTSSTALATSWRRCSSRLPIRVSAQTIRNSSYRTGLTDGNHALPTCSDVQGPEIVDSTLGRHLDSPWLDLGYAEMSANGTSTLLSNPFTPMAFLEPTLADHYEGSRYLYVATTGASIFDHLCCGAMANRSAQAFVWDWLVSLPQEVQLLRHHHTLPTLVYFISRFVHTSLAWLRIQFS